MSDRIRSIHCETPTARKSHICDACCKAIDPGTRYVRQRNTHEGEVWTYRAHPECLAAALKERAEE